VLKSKSKHPDDGAVDSDGDGCVSYNFDLRSQKAWTIIETGHTIPKKLYIQQ
jgi:hypothetical protein